MGIELQAALSIFSGVFISGIAYGMFRGSFNQYKADTDIRISTVEKNVSEKVVSKNCAIIRTQCREEIIRSLDKLQKGQDQIMKHLLDHKNDSKYERRPDNDTQENNLTS